MSRAAPRSAAARMGIAAAVVSTVVGGVVATALVAAPAFRAAARAGWPEDSLRTLTPAQAALTAALTASAAAVFLTLVLGLSARAARRGAELSALRRAIGAVAAVGLGLLAFAAVFTLVPQLHYTLYRGFFPGLPAQWVAQRFLQGESLVALMTFTAEVSLSRHGAGIVAWAAAICAAWPWAVRRPNGAV